MIPARFSADELRAFATRALHAAGFSPTEAAATAESLARSNLAGHDSHGVVRVVEYSDALEKGVLASGVRLSLVATTPHSCLADAHRGLGQVMMPALLDDLLARAPRHASVTGAMRNCGHIGRLGEWAERIGAAGMLGFVAVNDNGVLHFVAPPGGREGRTSTNPLAFALPLPNGETFVLDMSTSSVAMGKVRLAHLAGVECPHGVLQDAAGRPTTDPGVMFSTPTGALLPLGGLQSGYKGFALAMLVDLLTAGLSGGFAPPAPGDAAPTNNVLVCIWNPDCFAGLAHLQSQAIGYFDFIRASAPIDPARPVRLPGDRARAETAHRLRHGVPLDAATIRVLDDLATRLGSPCLPRPRQDSE